MPKLKSHKGLLKRIRITGRKKVTFHKSHAGHLRSGKGGKKLMKLRKKNVAKSGDVQLLQKMLHMRLLPKDVVRPVKAKKHPAPSATTAA
jgi:large subunit ribosomal protein L35